MTLNKFNKILTSQGVSVQAGVASSLGLWAFPCPCTEALLGHMARDGEEAMAPSKRRPRPKESSRARRARRCRADARTYERLARASWEAAAHHSTASSLVLFLRGYLKSKVQQPRQERCSMDTAEQAFSANLAEVEPLPKHNEEGLDSEDEEEKNKLYLNSEVEPLTKTMKVKGGRGACMQGKGGILAAATPVGKGIAAKGRQGPLGKTNYASWQGGDSIKRSGGKVLCQMKDCILEVVNAMQVCIKETGSSRRL